MAFEVPNVGDEIKFSVENRWKWYNVEVREWAYAKDSFWVTIFLENA